jgi:hypothetical protein
VARVAWPGVPPLSRGLFWQKISEVVSFGNSLVQVVSSVKNSIYYAHGLDVTVHERREFCTIFVPGFRVHSRRSHMALPIWLVSFTIDLIGCFIWSCEYSCVNPH